MPQDDRQPRDAVTWEGMGDGAILRTPLTPAILDTLASLDALTASRIASTTPREAFAASRSTPAPANSLASARLLDDVRKLAAAMREPSEADELTAPAESARRYAARTKR